MIQKFIGFFVILLGLINTAYADYRYNATSAKCSLMVYKEGKWAVVPASELPDDANFKTLSAVPNSTVNKAVRWNNLWYKSSVECFVAEADQEPPAQAPAAQTSEKEAKKDKRSPFFAEFFGQYVSFLGNSPFGNGTTAPGTTTNVSSFTTNVSYGLGIGWMFANNQGVAATFEHISGNQNASISDSGINVSLPLSASENHFSAHYFYYFVKSDFSPFFDLGLGSSIQSATTTISGFPAPATTYNGTVNFGGNAPVFNIKIGLDAKLGSFSIVPYVNYEWEKFSSVTVSSSSSAIFSQNTNFGASIERMIDLGVGLRYWF